MKREWKKKGIGTNSDEISTWVSLKLLYMWIICLMTCTASHLRPWLKILLETLLGILTIVNHDTQKPLDTREAKPTKNP